MKYLPVLLMMFFSVTACNANKEAEGTTDNSTAAAETQKKEEVKKEEKEPIVLISTDYGDMKVKLYNETPQHRDNFLKLAEQGFYDGLLFHRVIQNFMIQGGDPDSRDAAPGQQLGQGGPGYTIPAEFDPNFIHKKGALSAARMGDQVNPQKASSGSQFYIVQGTVLTPQQLSQFQQQTGRQYTTEQLQTYTTIGGTPHLDMGYTVFGEVIEGLEVIDKIAAQPTNPANRPAQDIRMTIKVLEK